MSEFHEGTKFRKGNQLWKARATHGRPRKFETPEALWQACVEYFEWVESNPLWEHKVFSFQGEIVESSIPKMRAMTRAGLCLFVGIDEKTWHNYGHNPAYVDYFPIVELAERTIFEQKFTGAAADMLNAGIIARDLGLADKQDLSHRSPDGSMTPTRIEIVAPSPKT